MSDLFLQLLITIVSSGTLGAIVTAIAKRRQNQSNENIQNIVKAQTIGLQNSFKVLQDNQVEMSKTIEQTSKTIGEVQKEIKEYRQEQVKIKSESRDIDLLMLKAMREKKIINGESDEIYKRMLDNK